MAIASSFAADLALAVSLCQSAGRHVVALRAQGAITTSRKASGDTVTNGDLESSLLIVDGLHAARPQDAVCSEEDPSVHIPAKGRTWFVDPIDGTGAYAEGRPDFAVMVGLAVDGIPHLGVIFSPVVDWLFTAQPGAPALLRVRGGTVRAIGVSSVDNLRAVLARAKAPTPDPILADAFGARASELGSVGLALCTVAMGARDIFTQPPGHPTWAWDLCAAHAVLEAAGGQITDGRGAALRYGAPLLATHGLLATNGRVHAAAVTTLAPLFRDPTRGAT